MINNILFDKYPLTPNLTLKNRIVMAPMTRVKADAAGVPTQAMADYYARRAEAGLIVTEGTVINWGARGHDFVPGIFTPEQVAGWRRVTGAVHEKHGVIFSQLWHVGRVSHPSFLNGELPVSASATVMTGRISRSDGLMFGPARAASLAEIEELIAAYVHSAKCAVEAGFDGIEIHAANGYLIDQFLHHHTNLRDDQYGGSIENRARFALEVVKACGAAIGFDRVAIRLSPGAYLNEIVGDVRDADVFKYLFAQLNSLSLAYVHTGNFDHTITFPECEDLTMTQFMRKYCQGTLIAAGSYDVAAVQKDIQAGYFDLVAIGRPFIANPDLISRLLNDQPLAKYDVSMLNNLY
jgi:2,4-dienoyl-CoA reductase-like NADH-dependent reductase (Old Yellow Enzyme family)